MNKKYKKKLTDIKKQITNLEVIEAQDIENLDATIDVKDFMNGTKNQNSEYFNKLADIWLKYKNQRKNLNAEYTALFLIATHIAERNKPLYSDEAIIKLKTYGKLGQQMSDQIDSSRYQPFVLNQYAYIYTKLYQKYGVKLFDENYARYLYKQIYAIQENINLAVVTKDNQSNIAFWQKQLDKYNKEFNTFNQIIRNKVIDAQRQQEIPF